ncbi:amine oxidase [Delitschia confertaspora ATCC 74209]|uniref:Amine oxidase n=1 Tax=Delitschia confertaspora ATCC 74209 TaxID=1513339 RepID=A0A9P4JD26_9PLEO|nr:amine oxidase [Delitschia confertaspora ATCC 74209]
MEHRRSISTNGSSPEAMSRLQRDLSSSPHQQGFIEGIYSTNMIRRTLGRIPHVGIIGAGVAGLRCADILLQHGVKVTILEGRNRVGGRLCQSNELGHLVDLGPNWIHGTDDNPILDLAKETRTITNTWDGRQSIFDQLGKLIPEKDALEYGELVWTVIEQAMKYSNENTASIPATMSLWDFFQEKVKEFYPSEMGEDGETNKKGETLLKIAEMWGAFVGSPIQRQSLKFFWLEECIDGENLFVAETYHKILARIAEPALQKAEIKFGHKVTKIISSRENEQSRVTVNMEEQEPLEFDEVVTTTPLGWLKIHKDAFEPQLPARLCQAIDAIGYGHLDKVYITFPSAFWNESPQGISTPTPTPTEQTIPNVPATTAPLHQSTSDVPTISPHHYPGFTHWTSPTYAPDTNPNHWQQECVNLAALPPGTAHPTLLFYTFGPTSLHLASRLRTAPPSTHQALLFSFFAPYFSLLPNYSPTHPSCEPLKALATAWTNDELAGYGSYCNFQVGLERGDEDVEVMRRGCPERGVWFAGEHTAPFVALGTVTGAWWAGEGVGRKVLAGYGLGKREG